MVWDFILRYTNYMKVRRIPKWVRILVPSALLLLWIGAGAIGGPYFGRIEEVSSNDQSTFLPASAESTKVNDEIKKFQDTDAIPVIIAFENDSSELTSDQQKAITEETMSLSELPGITGDASPPIISDDNQAALLVLNISNDAESSEVIEEIRSKLDASNLSGLYTITGPAGFTDDLSAAFSGIDGLLLGVALAVVFIILLVVYRSPILPFLVLLNSVFALSAAILVVFYLAKADVVTLNGQVQGILFILVVGAATDYALLFIARYKEELLRHKATVDALLASWKQSLEPILAAGGTVIAGLLCLLLSDLNSNKALGPVGAIGILFAITSALTLLPSLLLLFGRKAFWPQIPRYAPTTQKKTHKGIWPRIAAFVQNHTRSTWLATSIVLLIAAFGVFQLKADGVAQSDLILGSSEARDGQQIINDHFADGLGTPAYVIAPTHVQIEAVDALKNIDGVASVSARANDSPSGTLPLDGSELPGPFRNATIKEIDEEVLLEVTLSDPADSRSAQDTIVNMRTTLRDVDSAIQVGGTTAVQLDTNIGAERDRAVVIPTILVIITIILIILLRSILAPLLLLLTTVVSFASALGVSAILFNHVWNFPGADPSVVLYGFVFLVALGIDYNIFLMTRVREEALKHGTQKGVLKGLVVTGGVITSAGIVLAATFAALAVIPILFLAQLAFIVAFGVLVDTIIVRSLLVPALIYDIGSKSWWPFNKSIK